MLLYCNYIRQSEDRNVKEKYVSYLYIRVVYELRYSFIKILIS